MQNQQKLEQVLPSPTTGNGQKNDLLLLGYQEL